MVLKVCALSAAFTFEERLVVQKAYFIPRFNLDICADFMDKMEHGMR
jgi:hypothetical protein